MNPGTANTPAGDWHDRARQSARDFYPLLRRLIWLAVVYGTLITTLEAQELPVKPGASPDPAPTKEDLSMAPAKVDVNPLARDE